MERTETGLKALRDREATLRKAAEIADIPYVEMLSLAANDDLDTGYTIADLERDLERI